MMNENSKTKNALIEASKALYHFWQQWGYESGEEDFSDDAATRYQYVLGKVKDAQHRYETLSSPKDRRDALLEGLKACVTQKDWDSGFRDLANEQKSLQKLHSLFNEVAPRIDGVNQPSVPLPFQGVLGGEGQSAPKLVVLTSNPGQDTAAAKMLGKKANKDHDKDWKKHRQTNLDFISGNASLPSTLSAEAIKSSDASWIGHFFAGKPGYLLANDNKRRADQFSTDEFLQIEFFPYQSKKFAKSRFSKFSGVEGPDNWLDSQKLTMAWLVAFIDNYRDNHERQRPLIVTRMSNDWSSALKTYLKKTKNKNADEILQAFEDQLYCFSSTSSAWLTTNNIIPFKIRSDADKEKDQIEREAIREKGKKEFRKQFEKISQYRDTILKQK